MPVIRIHPGSSSDYNGFDNIQFPLDISSSPSTLSPNSPLSPAWFSFPFHHRTDSTTNFPISNTSTPIKSRRPSFDSGYGASSDRRVQRNLERDPNWIPRPRNSFIIFRCNYVLQHCQEKDSDGTSSGVSGTRSPPTKESLSMQAAKAWKVLPKDKRKIYEELAKIEKEAHEKQYPHYKFRPIKRSSPYRRDLRLTTTCPDVRASQPYQRSQTEIPEDSVTDLGYNLRWLDARRFSESQLVPMNLPTVPAQVDKMVKAARRRSSSVPLPGVEPVQYLQPWLPTAQCHMLLESVAGFLPTYGTNLALNGRPTQLLQNVDPTHATLESFMPTDKTYPDDNFWPETFENFEALQLPYTDPTFVHGQPSFGPNIQDMHPMVYASENYPVPQSQWSSLAGATSEPAQTSSLWGPTPSTSTSQSQPLLSPLIPAIIPEEDRSAAMLDFDEDTMPDEEYQFPPKTKHPTNELDAFPILDEGHATGLPMHGGDEQQTSTGIHHATAGTDPSTSANAVVHDEQPTSTLLPALDFGELYLGRGERLQCWL